MRPSSRPSGVPSAGLALIAIALWTACGDDEGPIDPSPAPVATVALNVVNDTFLVRSPINLVATLRDSAGTALEDREIAWSTSDPALATVSATGEVETLALGVVTITATSEGKSASSVLTLAPRVTISRRLPTTFAGDTTLLVAALSDVNRNPIAGAVEEWTSSDETVATVAPDGVVTGVAPGLAIIRATSVGGIGSVELVVLDPTPRANREIAYLRTTTLPLETVDELRRVGSTGADRGPLTEAGQYVAEYQWSPDGDRIVALYLPSGDNGKAGLYTIRADGTDERELVPQSFIAHDRFPTPRWSPDGAQIIFAAGLPSRIFRVNADGTGRVPVTPSSVLQGDDRRAEWSPDGRQIGYVREVVGCDEFWLMEANGTNRRLVDLPVPLCEFAWSPDGKLIAFINQINGTSSTGVWLMNADGSDPRPFTPNCSPEGECTGGRLYSHPRWAPDGRRLSYLSTINGSGSYLIHVSDLARSSVTEFPAGDGLSVSVDWSPDGTRLAFTDRAAPTDHPSIMISLPDGTGQVPIVTGENAFMPAWRR